ncbi:MAG TPA: hypothetical protein VGI70_06385, partial [Polyangiales bacterium]
MARRSYRSLILQTLAVLTLGFVLGVVGRKIAVARRPAVETARLALASGNESDAEKTLWHLLQTEPPTMDRFVLFLDAHEQAGEPHSGEVDKNPTRDPLDPRRGIDEERA